MNARIIAEPTAFDYRMALEADIPLLINLRIEFLTELYGTQPQTAVDKLRGQLVQYFTHAIPGKTYCSIICELDKEAIGLGGLLVRTQPGHILYPEGRTGYLMNMYTMPCFRRRGIGGQVLRRLIDIGKELHLDKIELHAAPSGEGLYKKYQFMPPKSTALELLL